MKLLFDHHVSFRLAHRLADLFPDSSHLVLHGLDRADDTEVWEFARINGFTLVTKDADFSDLSMLRGFPPKVVWIRLGNCTTAQIEALLRQEHHAIEQLGIDADTGLLLLS